MAGPFLTKAAETAGETLGKKAWDLCEKFVKKVALAYNVNIPHLVSHFEDYLKRAYREFDVANTLAFSNQGRSLRDIYFPLTLIREGIKPANEKPEYKIDQYPEDLFSAHKRILIKDTAGMGKSTMSKFLFLEAIDQEKGIPFFIELRNLSSEHGILEEIRQQLKSLTKEFELDLLLRLLEDRDGSFIFFLDGYDEIAQSQRDAVTADLTDFISQAGANTFVLTSRSDSALPSFGGFVSYRIRPLTADESYQLLRKYDSNGETSAKLVEKIKSVKDDRFSVFLQNPLLASLLFLGFNYEPEPCPELEFPMAVHQFYYQVYKALFDAHDQSKGRAFVHEKRSEYNREQFADFLRAFAYICFTEIGKPSFPDEDFDYYIKEAQSLSGVPECDVDLVENDLLQAVPLLKKEGLWVSWVHKSFMEFFAADYIHRYLLKKKNYVRDLAAEKDVSNSIGLLVFLADLDEQTFKESVLIPVLREFIKFVDRPIESVENATQEQEQRIRRRRQFLFHGQTYYYLYDFSVEGTGWDKLGKTIDAVMPVGSGLAWIQFVNNNSAIIATFVPDTRYELVQLVLRKYPQLKERNRPDKHLFKNQLP